VPAPEEWFSVRLSEAKRGTFLLDVIVRGPADSRVRGQFAASRGSSLYLDTNSSPAFPTMQFRNLVRGPVTSFALKTCIFHFHAANIVVAEPLHSGGATKTDRCAHRIPRTPACEV